MRLRKVFVSGVITGVVAIGLLVFTMGLANTAMADDNGVMLVDSAAGGLTEDVSGPAKAGH